MPENMTEDQIAAAAAAAGKPEAAQEAAEATAEVPAGTTKKLEEAASEAAEATDSSAVKAQIAALEQELKNYKAALAEANTAARAELDEADSKMLDDLSSKDPLTWLKLYGKLKAAGKIGKKAQSSEVSDVDRTRISGGADTTTPTTIEQARAGLAASLNRSL